jgi:hypothetical protein
MLVPLADPDELITVGDERIALFDFPPEALISIVIGARARPELIRELQSLLKDPRYGHITVQQAVLDEKAHRIVVEPRPVGP